MVTGNMMTTWLLRFVLVYGHEDIATCAVTGTLTSGREMEVVPVSELEIGSLAFTDRDYPFSNVGSYNKSCYFIRCANDDKDTASDLVQTSLVLPCASTIYLDFWGGPEHAGRFSWLDDWTEAQDATPTVFTEEGDHIEIHGPGIVMKRDFVAGTTNLLGNDGHGKGTYYAFVCPSLTEVDFKRIDKNGDGMLSYTEVTFDMADVNKDGLLSLEEYENARAAGILGTAVIQSRTTCVAS